MATQVGDTPAQYGAFIKTEQDKWRPIVRQIVANWPVLARVAPGNLLPDFPLINKSFELCYACADR